MATISVQLSLFSGETGLTLWLYNAGVLLNTGGDTLTETGSTGFFSATVAEAITSSLTAVVKQDGNAVYDGFLIEGQTQIDLPVYLLQPSPVAGNTPQRTEETTIRTFSGETFVAQVSGLDSNGNVIDWTALGSLEFIVEDERKSDVLVIANASITKAATYFQVTIPASVNVANQRYKWAIRTTSDDNVILYGNLIVSYAPEAAA